MAVFRIEKTRDYTVMSNYHLRDMSLSLKAKGLLSLMLSLPENWDYTMKGLALRRIGPVLVRVRQDEHFLFGRFPRAERQPEQQKRQPERQEHKARCDQQRDANVLHSRAPIHRPRMLMTPCRAKLASAHGAASSMTTRQSASSRLRAAMRSHCPRETGVTPK